MYYLVKMDHNGMAMRLTRSHREEFEPFKPRIKSHLLFAGIIMSSLFSPR